MLDTGLREILSKTTRQRTKEGGDERLAAHPVNTSPGLPQPRFTGEKRGGAGPNQRGRLNCLQLPTGYLPTLRSSRCSRRSPGEGRPPGLPASVSFHGAKLIGAGSNQRGIQNIMTLTGWPHQLRLGCDVSKIRAPAIDRGSDVVCAVTSLVCTFWLGRPISRQPLSSQLVSLLMPHPQQNLAR